MDVMVRKRTGQWVSVNRSPSNHSAKTHPLSFGQQGEGGRGDKPPNSNPGKAGRLRVWYTQAGSERSWWAHHEESAWIGRCVFSFTVPRASERRGWANYVRQHVIYLLSQIVGASQTSSAGKSPPR